MMIIELSCLVGVVGLSNEISPQVEHDDTPWFEARMLVILKTDL